MGYLRYNFLSEALSLSVDVSITFPSGNFTYSNPQKLKSDVQVFHREKPIYAPDMKFQTVYMLHGGSDDDTTLYRNTRLEYYAEKNGVMTVCAQVKDSFYMDTQYGYRYFTFMTEELPRVVQSLFASSSKREDNFVIGTAMGGNGALALALKCPELYEACVDLSGGIGCSVDTDYFIQELTELKIKRLQSAFGAPETLRDSEYDLGYYARKSQAEGIKLPKLFIGVGEQDFIRDVVRKDRNALRELGVDVYYEEAPGYGHDWEFWDRYVQKALDEWLPLKRQWI